MAPAGFDYMGPLDECVFPGVNLSFAVASHLALKLCDDVSDYNGVFRHVCERFKALWDVLVDKETDESYSKKVKELLPRFIHKFNEFWACICRSQAQTTLVFRIAEIRVTMDRINELHKALDAMLVELSPELAEKMNRWRERNNDDWDQQQARMNQMLLGTGAMYDGLTDEGAVESLTCLNYEIEYHPDENKASPRMLMLREAFDRLMFVSHVVIGNCPAWFIPTYEVNYTNPEELEEGTFGKVTHCTDMSGARAIIKLMLEDSDASRKKFLTEAMIWKQLDYQHVIRLYNICHVGKPNFFVCEDAENGNFADYFKDGAHRGSMWRLFHEASLGLLFLHDKKIVHGNLKCHNLLVGADGKAKVSDFGFAFHRSASKALSKKAQTEGVRWKSPECLRGETENPDFTSDVFSFGLCIIEAFTNQVPWGYEATDNDITSDAFEMEGPRRPDGMSDNVWSLVESMVRSDPRSRSTMEDVCAALQTLANEEVQTNNCTNCGSSISEYDEFCSSCGLKTMHLRDDIEMTIDADEDSELVEAKQSKTVSVNDVNQACYGMFEAKPMFDRVCARLVDIKQQLNIRVPPEYQEFINRVHAFLQLRGNKRMIIRLVSYRQVMQTCKDLHKELDEFVRLNNIEARDVHEWESHWKEDTTEHESFFKHSLSNLKSDKSLMKIELRNQQTQSEMMTLLIFECKKREEKYSEEELELIRNVFNYVGSLSSLGIPDVPPWFQPLHEVIYLAESFARGSYASVHKGTWNETVVVVKCVSHNTAEFRDLFRKEADLWHQFRHPHVVQLLGACHVGNPFFICEYVGKGTLTDYLYRNGYDKVKMWKRLSEAALGLEYLHHKHKVVHGDLKCNNILVGDDDKAKIADFGLSFVLKSDNSDKIINHYMGAIGWKAPEVIAKQTRGTFASDVYSFGMCILEVFTKGSIPWGFTEDSTVKRLVVKEKQLPKKPDDMKDSHWELVKRMCANDPSERLKMKEVVTQLQEIAEDVDCDATDAAWKEKQTQDSIVQAHEAHSGLTDMKQACLGMYEAQPIFNRVYERLVDISQQPKMKELHMTTAKEEFMQHLDHILDFLAQHSNKREIIRLVTNRRVVQFCKDMHGQLDDFVSHYCLEPRGVHEWLGRWNEDKKDHESFFNKYTMQFIENTTLLTSELQDRQTQSEIVTLLSLDCEYREHEEAESKLIRCIFGRIGNLRKLNTSVIPAWFVSPHEIDFPRQSVRKGSFVSLHLGEWNDTNVAIQCVTHFQGRDHFWKKVQLWIKLQHPHIIRFFGACHVGNPFFVCEFASRGTLSEFLYSSNYESATTWKKLYEAALGIRYLHEKHDVVHGNLMCNNILISADGTTKIGGFSMSFVLDLDGSSNISDQEVEAISWKAPEVIDKRTRGTFASDVYSFGMCILEAVKSGSPPWGVVPDVSIKHLVVKGKQLPKKPDDMNDSHWELVKIMCSNDPSQRLEMDEVVRRLRSIAEQEKLDANKAAWKDEQVNKSAAAASIA